MPARSNPSPSFVIDSKLIERLGPPASLLGRGEEFGQQVIRKRES